MQKNKQNTLQSVPDNAPIVTSAWISAHAGSGKTHALVSRIVKLLLLGVPAERITAITYTRAAAAEMRERVVRQLRELMLATDAICQSQCAMMLGRSPTADELARARGLFAQILDSATGGIELTTIHGFCQKLLRAFPLEANVPPYFTVLEEQDAALLLHRATQRLFDDDEDTEITHALAMLAERMAESTFNDRTAMLIATRALWETLFQHHNRQSLRAALMKQHGFEHDVTFEQLLSTLCQLPTAGDAHIIRGELATLYSHKNKTEQKLAASLERWLTMDMATRCTEPEILLDIFLTEKRTPRARILNAKDYPEGSPLRIIMERLSSAAITYVAQQSSLACVEETYAAALVAHALSEHYEQLKSSRAALDYEDLIRHTIRLLTVRDMTAWVMTKLDHRIDHLLIDEAQDTSAGQWQIVCALVEELIANSNGIGSGGIARSLFVVGDEKQSIFSFQGANPALFSQYRRHIESQLHAQQSPFVEGRLDISRRSAPAIIALVNQVVALPHVAASIGHASEAAMHQVYRTQAIGRVVLYPLIPLQEKTRAEPFAVPQTYHITRTTVQVLAESIAATIEEWLSGKRILAAHDRAVTAGDILILVRQRQRLSHCLIRALQSRNIPVAGLDRLNLGEHLAVRDMLALIRWVHTQADDLALAQLLRSPLIGMEEAELCNHAYGRGNQSLWQRVSATTHGMLLQRWHELRHLPTYEFLTEVLEVDGKRRVFAERFGEEIHEVLDELKSEAQRIPMLAQFEEEIRVRQRIIKREQETGNVVRIMTVHGAKGLEAPIVILADTLGMPDLRKERFFITRDEQGVSYPLVQFSALSKDAPLLHAAREEKLAHMHAEYQRLLYVAITRAADELHVFGAGENPASECWYSSLTEAFHALPHRVYANGVLEISDAPIENMGVNAPLAINHSLPLPEWAVSQATKEKTPALLNPSQLGAPIPVAASRFARKDGKERGTRIHRILQSLHAKSSAEDIHQLVEFYAPDWDVADKAATATAIERLYNQERWIWEHGSQAEVGIVGTIYYQGNARPIVGQVDRLALRGNALWILDFKTGASVASQAENIDAHYIMQLKSYAELLAPCYPDHAIRCGVVATHIPAVVDISEQVNRLEW